MLSVSLLGDFNIRYAEAPVTDIDTPRMQSLLAYLILHRHAPQSRAYLAFLFWPDTSEAQARTNLRNLLHHLRHALPNAIKFLEAGVHTLQWRCDAPFSLDVADFEAALVDAQQAKQVNDLAAFRQAMERALALYKGNLLPSCYDDWIIPQREELHQAYLDTLDQLAGLLEEKHDYLAAIHNAQRLLRDDPLHEATYRRLIRLHALNGDRPGALRVYHTCTTILQRELGVEPGSPTREAYERLLDSESQPSPTIPVKTTFTPLIGREKEWTLLLQAWRTVAAGGPPNVVIIGGEAGIGKTRLLEELLQWSTRQGITSANAHCYAAEGDLAYAPVTTWLRTRPMIPLEDIWLAEIARLLPELLAERPDLPKPVALTEAWQRQRLFEALTHSILGWNQPTLLTIDDLQWCDLDTFEWLHFLLRFDPTARLLVVGTYRPEEIAESHPLVSFLQASRLEGHLTELELQPLDEVATQTLASLIVGMEISLETAGRLYQQTEGNPLFVVESVQSWLSSHSHEPDSLLLVDSSSSDVGLPPRVQSMLEARLSQLSHSTRELAGLAATIGRAFSFKLLAKVSDQNEDILVGELDELWRRRIVREHGADAYDFSHDKLREVAYNSLSAARRRLLHHRIAQGLEMLHAAQLDAVSHQIAVHYERAGLPALAVPYYLRAAKVARQVYANEEAIALLKCGLALLAENSADMDSDLGAAEIAAQLWEEMGDILELNVQHEPALEAYANAQTHLHPANQIGQALLHHKMGAVMREQRRYAQALEACQRAETALGQPPDENASLWWDVWLEVQVNKVWAHYWLAQWLEMDALVQKLQPLVQARGKVASRMRFLMASCLMHLRRERYWVSDEMLANSQECLAASREYGNMKIKIDCQFELGFLHLWRHEFVEAEEHLKITLSMAETAGYVPQRVLCLTYLTVLHRFRGEMDGVTDYALRSQELAEAAHMPDYVAAARGNLAWLAWRRGDLPAAQQNGLEALALWQQSPLVYPFQWLALLPLMGVALIQDRQEDAWHYARDLLEPTQQLLPERLDTVLKIAVRTKTESQAHSTRQILEQAMALAQEMSYL